MSQLVKRDDVIDYLAGFLAVHDIKDDCPNGLQVEGRPVVKRIVTSVSGSEELFKKAAMLKADMVIVHHGIFWDGQSMVMRGSLKKRVHALLSGDITLLGYHLPLDRHPGIGNNVLAAKGLGLSNVKPFCSYHGKDIGFCGRFRKPLSPKDFFSRVNRFFSVKALNFPFGPRTVKTAGVVSGGAPRQVIEAVKKRLDAYVTGEITESVVQVCREEGIHFVAAGHYATERPGIRALGEHLAKRFRVNVKYVDVPVPV
jgi:dinuclear metal center YbgI/SA1388 family protein